jgi:hypothetical protein
MAKPWLAWRTGHLRVRETDGLKFGRFLFGLVLKG